jgi:hypothetical protein
MALTMTQLKDRLRAILLLDENIKTTKTGSLKSIGSYPAAFVSTADGTYEKSANDMERRTRNMLLTIVIAPAELGRELEMESRGDVFFDSIPALFQTRPSLNTVDSSDPLVNVQNAQLTSDSGFSIEEIAGVNYALITFVLQVELLMDLTENR